MSFGATWSLALIGAYLDTVQEPDGDELKLDQGGMWLKRHREARDRLQVTHGYRPSAAVKNPLAKRYLGKNVNVFYVFV